MSGSGKAGNGRGNNRRRYFKRRSNDSRIWQEGDASGRPSGQANDISLRNIPFQTVPAPDRKVPGRGGPAKKYGDNFRGERAPFFERPKWVPPKINTEPLPVPDCPWCGRPIRDISSAIADKDTGAPLHFDCVAARIARGERLEREDTVAYIGNGRFGIVCFGGGRDSRGNTENRDFRIKKIIEWENKENGAEWRSLICDHYSVT